MTLADKINEEIKEAMKAREKEKLEALRSIKKVIIEAKSTKGAGSELNVPGGCFPKIFTVKTL
jgi:uncharacterized protein YqeY